MATYAIGDVQGCLNPLESLLKKIEFNQAKDHLWFTGDLVNRGPESLETLRFIKSLGDRVSLVLGNHDLALLAVASKAIPFDPNHFTFSDILRAKDCDELIDWLRFKPLLHHDAKLDFTMVHAGLHPAWDLKLAAELAHEVEATLQSPHFALFLKELYGNEPSNWDPTLKGFARLRFIVNCFTRLRFCSLDGTLELQTKESARHSLEDYMPWFEIPNRKHKDLNIIFGHWAALEGKTSNPKVFTLDTGCVWGKCLTAMRLEDKRLFTVDCGVQ
jgi:bis(5'-nucleosyl)-tetraphosphatase (symmetrical)